MKGKAVIKDVFTFDVKEVSRNRIVLQLTSKDEYDLLGRVFLLRVQAIII